MYANAEQHFSEWEAPDFGMPRATLLAALIVTGLAASLCVWFATSPTPQPAAPQIQVTQATLTTLPQPTPPPPPKVVPPPKPIPAVIPKPPPVQSKIAVATKPPPPMHHVFKPVPHPVINHAPPTPAPVSQPPHPAATAPQAAAAPAQPTSGIGPYGNGIYNIIQANQSVPPALAQLGVSGTAYITLTVAPDGHVISAVVAKSSGVPLIDQTALDHAEHATYPPFNNEMPDKPLVFTVPVQISPNTDQ